MQRQPLLEDSIARWSRRAQAYADRDASPGTGNSSCVLITFAGVVGLKDVVERLRDRHRPRRLRYLLVAESPPDASAGARRFFYSPTLTIDNLYRGVAE